MPTLNWIGKDKVVSHHLDVPFRTLEKQYTFASEGQDDGGNMIIHGDNLDALKALLPKYEGRVKCIYIDPPYNTGNEGWVYNDNVNDPKIRKWAELAGSKYRYYMVFDENDTGFEGAYRVSEFMELMKRL